MQSPIVGNNHHAGKLILNPTVRRTYTRPLTTPLLTNTRVKFSSSFYRQACQTESTRGSSSSFSSPSRCGKFRSSFAEPSECARILLRSLKCNADCPNPQRILVSFLRSFLSGMHSRFQLISLFSFDRIPPRGETLYVRKKAEELRISPVNVFRALSPQLYIFQATSGNSLHDANCSRRRNKSSNLRVSGSPTFLWISERTPFVSVEK